MKMNINLNTSDDTCLAEIDGVSEPYIDESQDTFTWLMKTWLRAMGGQSPQAFLTDQDKAMKVAIAKVFPYARHRFCLWHILKKLPEKISHVMQKHSCFMGSFKRCIYRSWSEEEFENRWWLMVQKYELHENEWIQSLYQDRKHWVPTFMRDTFFGGMSTTQRSESINSFFDKYVNKKTTLKEFVEKYKEALKDREKEEANTNFNTWHKVPPLKSPSPFKKQLSTMYTNAIFKKFQVEVLGVSGCFAKKEKEDETTVTFKVKDFEQKEELVVVWNRIQDEICCLCRSFEYKGFLCKHIMYVLHNLGIFEIPRHYILSRWTKSATKRGGDERIKGSLEHGPYQEQKHKKLCLLTAQINKAASFSKNCYDFAYPALVEILNKCTRINESCRQPRRWIVNGTMNMIVVRKKITTTTIFMILWYLIHLLRRPKVLLRGLRVVLKVSPKINTKGKRKRGMQIQVPLLLLVIFNNQKKMTESILFFRKSLLCRPPIQIAKLLNILKQV